MHAPAPWQGARYRSGQKAGHYESWFLRANHPSRREGFWIRYTIFAPEGRPEAAIGELWAIHFDGEAGRIRAGKAELPISACFFEANGLGVQIGAATLSPGAAAGEVTAPATLRWDLRYEGGGAPLLFLPEALYTTSLPKAKAVTPRPLVRFAGNLQVGGEVVDVDGWIGSENHNWGRKHTDTYAWGQVAGFDNAPNAFLEAITARLKIGPLWTPPMTIVVLRDGDQEYRLNALARSFRAKGEWRYFDWHFDARQDDVRLHGRISARVGDFVGLTYYNPPGGSNTCLNSKIATCELTLERKGQAPKVFRTAGRAAFEILTADATHGVPVVV